MKSNTKIIAIFADIGLSPKNIVIDIHVQALSHKTNSIFKPDIQ